MFIRVVPFLLFFAASAQAEQPNRDAELHMRLGVYLQSSATFENFEKNCVDEYRGRAAEDRIEAYCDCRSSIELKDLASEVITRMNPSKDIETGYEKSEMPEILVFNAELHSSFVCQPILASKSIYEAEE